MESSRELNKKTAKEAGYRLLEVRLEKNDTIAIHLTRLHSSCSHKLTVKSTFDQSSGNFPVVTPKCESCPASTQRPSKFSFVGGGELNRILLVCKMFSTYVSHIRHADTPREMIVAFSYILRAGASLRMKAMDMNVLSEIHANAMNEIDKQKPGSVRPPVAALDYRTQEGKRTRRKKRKGYITDIEMPKKIQTIETFVDGLKTCEAEHWINCQPLFWEECDLAVEMLTKEKVRTFDIAMEHIPRAMTLDIASNPSGDILSPICVSKKRKRSHLDSEDEDEMGKDLQSSQKKRSRTSATWVAMMRVPCLKCQVPISIQYWP